MMRRRAAVFVVLVFAAALIVVLLSPAAPSASATTWRSRHTVVAGAFHVHTDHSPDGSGTIEEAAAAARRAGLAFVAATEHGDGTRPPLPPAYRDGVLWIDGVEISTADGHYATFGLPQSPYPLAGDARDVAEDVRRLGGAGVAAHGDSTKSEAQWRDWSATVDGLEWLNLDSVWRAAGPGRLLRAAITYWFRPAPTLASLGSRPVATLEHADELARTRHVIALAASDVHGGMVPSYQACFETFSTRVELDAPLTGNAETDAAAIVRALRLGHHYTSVDALARPAGFEFAAREGAFTVNEGDLLPGGTPVGIDVHVGGPVGARTALLRNGVAVQQTDNAALHYDADGGAAEYRVEVTVPGSPGAPPLPWILSNPIFVGIPERPAVAAPAGSTGVDAAPGFSWRIEKDEATTATVAGNESGGDFRLQYALGAGAPANQFAAAVTPAPSNLARVQGIGFTVRAGRPLRFSVEIRAARDRRWQRSIYADATPRRVDVRFDDMRPVQPGTDAHPPLSQAEALLFLVGVSNTTPGTAGEITLSDVSLLTFRD